jgi:hypothetical protein
MEHDMENFLGYHSEWNLGSPGGWDYQRVTQVIGKEVWKRLNGIRKIRVDLDFDHPLLYPIDGFVEMLLEAHRAREGRNPGTIAVVAEEETLQDVSENINLAARLSEIPGITGALLAPHELEWKSGRVCHNGKPVSLIFLDFNTDILLSLHRKQDLSPLLAAVKAGRVINPRGTEPINVKSTFELITGPYKERFHPGTVRRTPWTRKFHPRRTEGPAGETIDDLIEWTRRHWDEMVLKPERGYSGKGVRVGGVHENVEEAIGLALQEGNYIVQEKIPLPLWGEDNPLVDRELGTAGLARFQTDFRCLFGPQRVFGFLVRFGGIPTNVGSGGGVQPLAILRSGMPVRDAVNRINEAILSLDFGNLLEVVEMQEGMALDHRFTYLLGPIRMALRPRVLSPGHIEALRAYCTAVWSDCLTLEKMWLSGEIDSFVNIEEEELGIARSQLWGGSHAVFASDGLFSFGAHPEEP